MMNLNKKEKGITLIILAITVTILIVITTTIAVRSNTTIQMANLTKLQNDIEKIESGVASYYVSKGELPLYEKDDESFSATKASLSSSFKDLSVNDGNEYYTIDLGETGLDISVNSLNYGKDYKKSNSTDRYVINEKTHVIYYLKGIAFDGTIYHTVGNNDKIK